MSPYISNANRWSDVISAIPVMAVYKFYKLDFNFVMNNSAYVRDKIGRLPKGYVFTYSYFNAEANSKRLSRERK